LYWTSVIRWSEESGKTIPIVVGIAGGPWPGGRYGRRDLLVLVSELTTGAGKVETFCSFSIQHAIWGWDTELLVARVDSDESSA
jgi:hypothetical protein